MEKQDPALSDPMIALAYSELRRLARHYLSLETPGHTLQPTALVHEAYGRILQQRLPEWQNKAHFLGIAAQMMRRILVDHARSKLAQKRGGGFETISVEDLNTQDAPLSEEGGIALSDVLAVHETLEELAAKYPEAAQIVELRYFGGLSIEEAAEASGRSTASLKRDWAFAKAWMFKRLGKR